MADIMYIRPNLRGMAVSGLWDVFNFKNKLLDLLFYAYGKTCWVGYVCFNISQFIEMFVLIKDFPALMQNMNVTLCFGLGILKCTTVMFRKHRIEEILTKIRFEEHRSLQRPEREVEIYQEAVEQNWFVSKSFWFICASTATLYIFVGPAEYYLLGPQPESHYKVPMVYSSWFPFDKWSDEYHDFAFAFQVLSGITAAYYIAMADTFFVAFMIFAIGQFRMIQCAIKRLHLFDSDEEMQRYSNTDLLDVYPKVVDIIKHHTRIIEYLDDVDALINLIIFMNFLICSLMMCALGLEAIMAGPSVRLVSSLYYLLALIVQLFMFYWHANEVTLESINIGQAISESEWYRFTKRVKHALLMILTRTQKPSFLSVGGFHAMSLSTFLMILRSAYSFLALFRTMYQHSEEKDTHTMS